MRKLTTVLFTLLLLIGSAAGADTHLVMKSHTDPLQAMGQTQPARDVETDLWIGSDRALRDDGHVASLIRLDQKKLYLINRAEKSYSVLDLPVDLMSLLPEQAKAQMGPMLEKMKLQATVEPSDERKEINGWNARRYDVHLSNELGMQVDSTVWMTQDVDVDLDSFRAMTRAIASLQPGGAEATEELLKLDGVPVLMENKIQAMGGSTSSKEELVSAETGTPPPGTYEVPDGFTEKEFNPMGGGPPAQ
jgi:hypothetical protein